MCVYWLFPHTKGLQCLDPVSNKGDKGDEASNDSPSNGNRNESVMRRIVTMTLRKMKGTMNRRNKQN